MNGLVFFLEYGITDLRNSQGALMANKSQVYTTLRLLSRYGLTQLQKFTTQLKAIKHKRSKEALIVISYIFF
jgi:hypothetical protein